MTIDLIIFIVFLFANLVLGLLAGSRVKTLREYAVGNKNFSTGAVTSTIVATWIGGGFMFYALQNIYTSGLQFIIALLGGSLCLLFTGQILAGRMGEFLHKLSIADAMKKLYGEKAQVITAISGMFRSIGGIAIQFKAVGKMLTLLLNMDGPWVTVAAASIVIIYSVFGGLRSVTITDIFQFITFTIFVPILALVIWNNLQHPERVVNIIDTSPLFKWENVIGWDFKTLSMLGLLLYYMIPGMEPDIFQRIAMAKDLKQVKDSFTYAAAIRTMIVLTVTWIAILLLADPATKDSSSLLNYIVANYTYPGLKGLIAIGVAAMAMSTADSRMNATAVLVVNDFLKPLQIIDLDKKSPLISARIASLIIGVLGLTLALSMQNLLKILLFCNSFYMPIVTVPFLLAVFGFRSKSRSMFIGMAAGFITVVLWSIFLDNEDSIIPGMLANIIFLMGSHYLLKEQGGWIGIEDQATLMLARQKRQADWKKLKYNLTASQIYKSLTNALPIQDSVYPLFAIYVIGATYISFFTVPKEITIAHAELYQVITASTLIATATFLTCPAWPARFKPTWLMSFAWPIGISYLLFVVGGILVVLSGFNSIQVMIFMLNLIIAALLLPWQLVILLCAGSLLIVKSTLHAQDLHIALGGPAASLQFKIFYIILLFSGSLLAIIRFKQRNSRLELKYTALSAEHQATTKDLVKALAAEERFVKALDVEGVKELEKTAVQEQHVVTQLSYMNNTALPADLQQELALLKSRLTSTAQYLKIVVHRATTYLQLQVTSTTPKKLVEDTLAMLQLMEIPVLPRVILEMQPSLASKLLEVDVPKLTQLLYHAIVYAQSKLSNPQRTLLLGIEESILGYVLNSIEGHVKRVPAIRMTITTQQAVPMGEKLYYSNMEQAVVVDAINEHNMHLVLTQRILQAHYGFIALEEQPGSITQVYVIPQDIRTIRPKEMDIPELDPEAMLQAADETYPGAKQQEEDFFSSLQIDDPSQLAMVHQALRFIKKYHGPVKRKSGEPFYLHPVMVAKIANSYHPDINTILGALLHDIVEDTAVTLPQIALMFNDEVAKIVDGVTHLDSLGKAVYKLQLGEHENFVQLLDAEDKRVLYVKLADRTHNIRTIEGHANINKQKQIAGETIAFFVPIAKYLGLMELAAELQARSEAVMNKE